MAKSDSFTTDEEVGKGVDKVDLELLDADFGYTLDGAELGKSNTKIFLLMVPIFGY
ncbi:MAG: hypothetical protein R2766_08330 [Saprospiraceae bacterium]